MVKQNAVYCNPAGIIIVINNNIVEKIIDSGE
jgi:hypothetical protein